MWKLFASAAIQDTRSYTGYEDLKRVEFISRYRDVEYFPLVISLFVSADSTIKDDRSDSAERRILAANFYSRMYTRDLCPAKIIALENWRNENSALCRT